MPIIQTTKQLRPREKNDFYPTPIELVRVTLDLVLSKPKHILDPGCGTGVWGRVAREKWPESYIDGVDIIHMVDSDFIYNQIYIKDFRDWKAISQFDLIISNPPYKYAEEFVRKSWQSLKHDGEMIFLMRLAFLESQKRCKGLWHELPPDRVYVLGRRPSFTGNGKTDNTAYALYHWINDDRRVGTSLSWLMWDYDD